MRSSYNSPVSGLITPSRNRILNKTPKKAISTTVSTDYKEFTPADNPPLSLNGRNKRAYFTELTPTMARRIVSTLSSNISTSIQMQTRNIFTGEATVGKAASRNKASKRPPPLRLRALSYLLILIVAVSGLFSPLQAASRSGKKLNGAVWQIEDDRNYGTAFAISPNLFITNAHNLRDTKRIGEIILSREGSSRRLSASQILSLSLVHDLVLLQTEETVRRYLRLGGPVSKKEDGTLHMIGYRKQTLTHFRQIAPIAWQDRFYYALPVNKINLSGASGSPILGSAGKVVAIANRASKNISYGLKSHYVRRLLVGDIGIFCSRPRSIRSCRDDGIAKMVAMSERGHVFAQFRLGLGTYTNKGNLLARFLSQSAQRGFMQAMQKLGTYHYDIKEFKKAHHWFIKAAKKNNPVSRYYLGVIFYFGKGEFARNREKAYRYFDRAAKAGDVFSKYVKGYMLYYGHGTRKDRVLGIRWLKEAAEIGDPEAKKLLEKLQK